MSFGFTNPHFESARATGINDSGQIIGTFEALQANGSVFNGSFLEQPDGTFVLIAPTNNTYLTSISNNGYILGTDVVNAGAGAFVMDSSLQVHEILDLPSYSARLELCSRRPGKYDLSALVTGRFMLEAVAARGLTKLTFERAIEGGFRLVSHFTGDFRYTAGRILK